MIFPKHAVNNERDEYIAIKNDVMKSFFSDQLAASKRLIEAQMKTFGDQSQHQNGSPELPEVLLIGGANNAAYVWKSIEKLVSQDMASQLRNISVIQPQLDYPGSLVAKGSLVLAQDKDFIGDRVLRRSYCLKWDRAVCGPNSRQPRSQPWQPIVQDSADGFWVKKDVSRFVLRKNEKIPYHLKRNFRGGWQSLYKEPDPQDTGFDLEANCYLIGEVLYYSDSVTEDDLWVDWHGNGLHPNGNDIHEAGKLVFKLDRSNCSSFERTRYSNEGKGYWIAEYEVVLEITGMHFAYRMVIPRSGRFMVEGVAGYGADPIVREGYLAFDMKGTLRVNTGRMLRSQSSTSQ